MLLHPEQFVDGWLLFGPQFYEPNELKFIESTLQPGDVFVDVGAHIGLFSLAASRVVGPSGIVVAIEADAETTETLRYNIKRNGIRNIRVVNCGVSDAHERRPLAARSAANRAGNSFLFSTTRTTVECRPLLEILRDERLSKVTGMKIDNEGFEYKVLAPFLNLAEPRLLPEFILTEFYQDWVGLAGGDTLAPLESSGYRLDERYGDNYILTRSRPR